MITKWHPELPPRAGCVGVQLSCEREESGEGGAAFAAMASASVPPPPEDDSLLDPLLFSQLTGTQQQDTIRSRFDEVRFSGLEQQQCEGYYGGDTTQHLKESRYFNKTQSRPQATPHYVDSRPPASSWGGDGFTGGLDGGSGSELPQRVPFTPSLQQQSSRDPSRQLLTVERRLDFSFDAPEEPSGRGHVALRPVTEIPEKYRSVFKEFPFFNMVQSKVFDDVLYTDLPLVLSAPTGSGKTVVFELAIIRLLQQTGAQISSVKIVYVAPMKALCSERFTDWQTKFGPLGLRCCELTGDSQLDDYFELQSAQIVMTTPEKWDSMTRRWRDHKSLVQLVRLFLIDEVHQLNDEVRGPTVEAIVSRMKTIRAAAGNGSGHREGGGARGGANSLRLIAVSATIPNISDLCSWLGSEDNPALEYKVDECHRPVRLRKVVLSYPSSTSDFKFNLSLNYRLSGVIHTYSDQKPCLVFCATRKGTQQAAATLVKDARFIMNSEHKKRLSASSTVLRDSKLRDLVLCGVGYHHAGIDISDRKTIESMFTSGDLPVLFSTSTLAMGVNLPAHLVVIKSTSHYVQGMFQEYTESQVLQMIGRAGRPQFDTTATAVIMTSHANKYKYEALLGGKQLIESCLHHNLIEHLNAEIVLHTITDVSIALEWLHSTFFYIRVRQNPKFYNFPEQKDKLEGKLQELLVKDLNLLAKHSLISMDQDGFLLQPTERGRLMARYCVAFKSMQQFLGLGGRDELEGLVGVVSQCQEFADVHLRVTEKRVLNTLNKDKNRATIRFPMDGKIKSKDMKVNCLIQAALGCLQIQEFSLNQDTQKIFRSASRLSKCLLELKILGGGFKALLSATLLHKCIQARLWENSKHVARQLDKIGVTISTTLMNAGLTTFDKIHDINPRELELIVNRHPPFGTQIRDAVARLPKYTISLEQCGTHTSHQADLMVRVSLANHSLLREEGGGGGSTLGPSHTSLLLVGDSADNILCKQRIRDSQLLGSGQFSRKLTVHRVTVSDELHVHYISLEFVGLDVREVFSPHYTGPPPPLPGTAGNSFPMRNGATPQSSLVSGNRGGESRRGCESEGRRRCNHRCINKDVCGHDCCRNGLVVKTKSQRSRTATQPPVAMRDKPRPPPGQDSAPSSAMKRRRGSPMTSFLENLHLRRNSLPDTPALKRIRPSLSTDYSSTPSPPASSSSSSLPSSSLSRQFSYTSNSVERMTTTNTTGRDHERERFYSRSRLVDQIYEDRQEGRGGRGRRGGLFQSARRAAHQQSYSITAPHQQSHSLQRTAAQYGCSLPSSEPTQGSQPPRRDVGGGRQESVDDGEMADFEDYIWDEWEEEGEGNDIGTSVSQPHPSHSGRNASVLSDRGSSGLSNPGRLPSASSSFFAAGLSRSSTIPPRNAVVNTTGQKPPTGPKSIPKIIPKNIPTAPKNTTTSMPSGPRIIPPVSSGRAVQTVPQPQSLPPRDTTTASSSSSSFFTAGPVDAHEEDDGSDLFGSVFAGIF